MNPTLYMKCRVHIYKIQSIDKEVNCLSVFLVVYRHFLVNLKQIG